MVKFVFGKLTEFFRVRVQVQVWVCSSNNCAVFLVCHDINKTVMNMHLCSCYEKRNLNLHGLINNKYFSDKFFIVKFLFSELEKFYSSSSSSSAKLFFWFQVRVRQFNGVKIAIFLLLQNRKNFTAAWGSAPMPLSTVSKYLMTTSRLWHAWVALLGSARELNQAVFVQKDLRKGLPLLAQSWLHVW